MSPLPRPAVTGRALTGLAWAVLLLALSLRGGGGADGPAGDVPPAHGDIAAVGRPLGTGPSPARAPLPPATPHRLDIPALGIAAPVVPRDLDRTGAVAAPPYESAHSVGWFERGTRPGARGPALFVGHVDTATRPAVFHPLGSARPGTKVRVGRSDGSVAEFTVEDVRVVPREGFDAHEVYGPRVPGRAELRLITCGGGYDRAAGAYTANVVVSAYLTGVTNLP
ncbi:class F sortase [Streptomyces sp. NPDC053755]|uniref:class F sortase n=1 Tax=Streptomyces sp. NPDC053755 TaxID=3155815 RepID=UPI003439D1FE